MMRTPTPISAVPPTRLKAFSSAGDFPMLRPRAGLPTGLTLPPGGADLEAIERDLVVQALDRAGWNQTRAATLLGLNRDQIRYRIKKFALTKRPPGARGAAPSD